MGATTLQDRVKIDKLSHKGRSDRQIATEIGFSIHTVRKWRRRIECEGKAGYSRQMGRPSRGALSTFPQAIGDVLGRWRKGHPLWGAKTLRTELGLSEAFREQSLPSRATIARWLNESGKTRPYEKHTKLPATPHATVQGCHEEWEMDARGYEKLPEIGFVSLIDINDTFSRTRVMSYPVCMGEKRIERYPCTEDYQQALRLAFCEWGLPDRLATDHDRVFYDETSKSPFPTRFHLWLIALGIPLTFGRFRIPEDQAVTERSHQIWDGQVLEGARFENFMHLYQHLSARKAFLNQQFPCASLGDQPPLVAHPEARLPRRPYRPEWEVDLMNMNWVYAYLGQGAWFRKVSATGAISIGGHIYHLGFDWRPAHDVEVTFDPQEYEFICRSASGKYLRLPAPWLKKTYFIDQLPPSQLPDFQFALPLSWNEWRALMYFQVPAIPYTGTTL